MKHLCAYHSNGKTNGTLIHFIYVPNDASGLSACGTNLDPLFTPNRHSEAANSTAHEVMESITDPNFDGWGNPTFGTEIGDPCNIGK
jgi:hypothetical protein